MVTERRDVLELLRKQGMDGEVDFLWNALGVLVDGIVDADVSAQNGAKYGERSLDLITHQTHILEIDGARTATASGAAVSTSRPSLQTNRASN